MTSYVLVLKKTKEAVFNIQLNPGIFVFFWLLNKTVIIVGGSFIQLPNAITLFKTLIRSVCSL